MAKRPKPPIALPDPEHVFHEAMAYKVTGIVLSQWLIKRQERGALTYGVGGPCGANSAFGLELLLKTLLLLRLNEMPYEHELSSKLFALLEQKDPTAAARVRAYFKEVLAASPVSQEHYRSMGQHDHEFDYAMSMADKLFVRWRYPFNSDMVSLDHWCAGPVAVAVMRVILELRPEWKKYALPPDFRT
jgi:hypothetical protein